MQMRIPVLALSLLLIGHVDSNADDIYWTGAVNSLWDTNTANWTADTSGRNDNLYANGDSVTFSNGPGRRTITVSDPVSPLAMLVAGTEDYDMVRNFAGSDQCFSGGMRITKRGSGELNMWDSGNFNSHTGGIHISGGLVISQYHLGGGNLGNGPRFLDGGTWSMNGMHEVPFDTHVSTNSTLESRTTLGKGLKMFGPIYSSPGAVLTIGVIQGAGCCFNPKTELIAGTWHAQIVDDAASMIVIDTGAEFDNTAGHLSVTTNGVLTEEEYPIIDYSSGALSGWFASETLPPGWTIDYDGTTENPFNVVLINPNPAPEPRGPTPFLIIY